MRSKIRLIIARHGNTFKPGDTPTRVGGRTDLELVESLRGESIGRYLAQQRLIPSQVYAAPLRRTMQTAALAVGAMGLNLQVHEIDDFKEIDYGLDENKSEDQVMLRLGDGDMERGRAVIDEWNNNATVPNGWVVDTDRIISVWFEFADKIASNQAVGCDVAGECGSDVAVGCVNVEESGCSYVGGCVNVEECCCSDVGLGCDTAVGCADAGGSDICTAGDGGSDVCTAGDGGSDVFTAGDCETVLLVSSNGIIRFAPYLTGDFESFARTHDLKVVTGGVCVFEKYADQKYWTCTEWNTKPYKLYQK